MLLKNIRFLLTQNEERDTVTDQDVLIRDGRIADIGHDLADKIETEEEVVDCSRKLVLPGLINAHTHVPMNLLRGVSDNKQLQQWLNEDVMPLESQLDGEDIYHGSLLAMSEMLKSGTTCFNDMYFSEGEIARASEKVGMRAVLSRAVMDIDGQEEGEKRLKESKQFLKKYQDHKLITPAVGPHSVYLCSKSYLKQAKQQAEEFSAPIHIHLSETKQENEQCEQKRGSSPTVYLNQLGLLTDKTIGAHGVWLSDNDLELIKEKKAGIAHCPCSNMKLGSGKAPVPAMKEINVGLATDGAASNNNLNLWEEGKFASLLQKVDNPERMTQQRVLDLMTIEAARVLGLEQEIGSVEEGKRADLALIDLDRVDLTPHYGKQGLVSNLIFAFNGQVSDVIIDGNWALREGTTVNLDQQRVQKQASAIANKLEAAR